MNSNKFATCLNCIDGRVQVPVIQWIQENYDVDYVDMITEVGMDGVVSANYFEIDRIMRKVGISIEMHGSKNIFIVGHDDCAGNPVNEEEHKKQICKSVEKVKNMKSFCKVTGLWVSKEWLVEKISEQ